MPFATAAWALMRRLRTGAARVVSTALTDQAGAGVSESAGRQSAVYLAIVDRASAETGIARADFLQHPLAHRGLSSTKRAQVLAHVLVRVLRGRPAAS